MKVLKKIGLLTLLVAFSLNVNAQTEVNKSNEGVQSDAIKALSLASDLVNYGQANKDAYSLVSAAKIILENPVQSARGNRVSAEEGSSDAPASARGEKSGSALDLDVKAILAEASKYTSDNSDLKAVIASLEKELNSRGSRGYAGAGYVNGTWSIPAYGSRTFKWTFTGGEVAEILFNGDDDTDLDFYVYDTDGNLLGSDIDATDYAYFSWYPPYTKQYVFKVVNRGSVYNNCRIVSN